jgi:hypothetical protein
VAKEAEAAGAAGETLPRERGSVMTALSGMLGIVRLFFAVWVGTFDGSERAPRH